MKHFPVIVLLVHLVGCGSNYKTLPPEAVHFHTDSLYSRVHVPCSNLMRNLTKNKFNFYRGVSLLEYRDSAYLVFKGNNYLLHFLSMSALNDTAYKYPKSFIGSNYFKVCDSFLIDFDRNSNKFYYYTIGPGPTLSLTDSSLFDKPGTRKSKSPRTEFLSTNFLYKSGKLIVNYSCRKGINFIDHDALGIIEKQTKRFTGKYPAKYLNRYRVRNANTIFTPVNDSVLAMGFTESDEITTFKYDNTEIKRVKLSNDTSFMKLDKDKAKNLAYIDKLVHTNEKNINMFTDKNGNLLFFKLAKKAKKESPNVITCYVMNTQLEPRFKFQLTGDIFPYFIFPYKKGFIAFSQKIDSYDYYEIR